MHVSMVELKAALRRCFEATGYFVGNYEDAAEMILWLEKHGLNGLAEFNSSLPYISQDQDKQPSTIVYEDSTAIVIDSHNRSSLNSIAAALDVAYCKSIENGIATVTIRNCHNRMFVLKALTDCGRRGVSVVAYWKNGSAKVTEHTAAIKAGHKYPSYQYAVAEKDAQVDLQNDQQQSLTIICSTRVDLSSSLKSRPGDSQNKAKVDVISSAQIAANKLQSVEYGIEITEELWASINQIGEGVLVENSEESRRGAGA
jgi:LDH2 family malate/lactate/ureidoglycolate dehydrogenase